MRFLRGTLCSLLAAGFAVTACVSEQSDVAAVVIPPEAGPPSSFVDHDASADARADAPETPAIGQCIATSCPAGYDTCPAQNNTDKVYLCQTNLGNDNDNCGACGHACPAFTPLQAGSSCVDGKCRLSCTGGPGSTPADCNGILDDGCEVNLRIDAKNCGVCGNICTNGEKCVEGKCGCSGGLTDCNPPEVPFALCVDLNNSTLNCGACGVSCGAPAGAPAPPFGSGYGCNQGTCPDYPGCIPGRMDCNDDLTTPGGNGCETNVASDPANCGACGHACPDGLPCLDLDGDHLGSCGCETGKTLCTDKCVDLTSDLRNCGACGRTCETFSANTTAVCRKGLCELECPVGYGDCDGLPDNGCETNMQVNGAHCGACGHACDTGAGQPCINGACLTQDCPQGPIQ